MRLLCLLAATFALVFAVHAAEPGKKSFNIPTDDAEHSLKKFSAQSGLEVLFVTETAANVKTSAVQGDFTVREAIDRMLQGTNLVAAQDEKTGALRILPNGPNAPRAAQMVTKSDRPNQNAEIEASTVRLEQVEVTGSRIRTLLGEQTAQPMLTITGREIERYGVSSLGDLFRYIPQVSSFESGQLVESPGLIGSQSADVGSTRVSATLRGAPVGGTLLLINGRRAPKNGQGGSSLSGAGAYDLSGIPLAAIERIDVLLDGASAVYGADAVGGVINVILKKNYRGSEIRLSYENTFDKDAGVKTASFTHGFAFGKLSGLLTASWESANSMMWRDRWFLKTFDRRPFGGSDFRDSSSTSGSGRIRVASGNLPGLTTSQVTIPAGANGVNVTVQDYANAGPVPGPLDYGEYSQYSTPYRRKSILGRLEYEFSRWLTAFAEARWGKSRTWSSSSIPLSASNITVPAGAPGNPFGVPVILSKFFFDRELPPRVSHTENQGFTAGARGQFFNDWRYESAINLTATRPDLEGDFGGSLTAAKVRAAFNSSTPPILLYDSTRVVSPNPPGTLEALTTPPLGAERGESWTYDAKADGPVFTLPAGKMQVSFGAEYREEYVDFPVASPNVGLRSKNRYTLGDFAEVRVPLISDKQQWLLINRLEVTTAVRHDRYSDFPGTTNPRYGLLYRPFQWLMLRGSYGEGYKVPALNQLYRPASVGNTFFAPGAFLDALRGNTPVISPLPVTTRGNPNLRPERSKNTTAGAVFEVPGVKGLSFSYDYYNTDYVDRVGNLTLTDQIVLFPETIRRGSNLPTDPPGWAGPIIGYDLISFNIATNRITGYDLGAKYNRVTDRGEFTFNAAASRTTRYEVRSTANLPPTIASTPDQLPLQARGSLFWTRGSYETGALFAYRAKFRASTTTTAFTPSTVRWDWQGSYDFGRSAWLHRRSESWWAKALADTRLSLTIFNVFNTEPPLRPGIALPDNIVVDSRLRRYGISLEKKF